MKWRSLIPQMRLQLLELDDGLRRGLPAAGDADFNMVRTTLPCFPMGRVIQPQEALLRIDLVVA